MEIPSCFDLPPRWENSRSFPATKLPNIMRYRQFFVKLQSSPHQSLKPTRLQTPPRPRPGTKPYALFPQDGPAARSVVFDLVPRGPFLSHVYDIFLGTLLRTACPPSRDRKSTRLNS